MGLQTARRLHVAGAAAAPAQGCRAPGTPPAAQPPGLRGACAAATRPMSPPLRALEHVLGRGHAGHAAAQACGPAPSPQAQAQQPGRHAAHRPARAPGPQGTAVKLDHHHCRRCHPSTTSAPAPCTRAPPPPSLPASASTTSGRCMAPPSMALMLGACPCIHTTSSRSTSAAATGPAGSLDWSATLRCRKHLGPGGGGGGESEGGGGGGESEGGEGWPQPAQRSDSAVQPAHALPPLDSRPKTVCTITTTIITWAAGTPGPPSARPAAQWAWPAGAPWRWRCPPAGAAAPRRPCGGGGATG